MCALSICEEVVEHVSLWMQADLLDPWAVMFIKRKAWLCVLQWASRVHNCRCQAKWLCKVVHYLCFAVALAGLQT